MTVFAEALRLAGATAPAAPAPETNTVDLAALTVAQLLELCEGRGIAVPRKATKARLLELLSD